MIRKTIYILCAVILFICSAHSQDHLIGMKAGFLNPNLIGENILNGKQAVFSGLNYEFVPPKAMFSISAEAQYIINSKWLLIPISINLKPGNEFKFILSGGVLPVIRLDKVEPDETSDIGGLCKIGFEYQVNRKISIICNSGLFFIPGRVYYYSRFGDRYIEKTKNSFLFISFGVNYCFLSK